MRVETFNAMCGIVFLKEENLSAFDYEVEVEKILKKLEKGLYEWGYEEGLGIVETEGIT